jgi:hypothetical protein
MSSLRSECHTMRLILEGKQGKGPLEETVVRLEAKVAEQDQELELLKADSFKMGKTINSIQEWMLSQFGPQGET